MGKVSFCVEGCLSWLGKVFVVVRLSACLWEVLCERLPQLWLPAADRAGLCLGRAREHLRGKTVRSGPVSFQVGWVGSNVGLMPTGQRRGLLAILATGPRAGSMALSAASEDNGRICHPQRGHKASPTLRFAEHVLRAPGRVAVVANPSYPTPSPTRGSTSPAEKPVGHTINSKG